MAESLEREDFLNNVQITGWLYQYFISPRKDGVYEGLRRNNKITREDIPAATQLFTPEWVVKYMVENSLGRLWLDTHPDSSLRQGWHYYIEEAGQPAGVRDRLKTVTGEKLQSPESIRIMDPAMGSGNILVYAFDLLYEIYLSQGYKEDGIPALIIKNNLYGLDIDERAAGLACFALMMKARSKDKGFLRKGIKPNLYVLQESGGLTAGDVMPLAGTAHRVTIPEGCIKDMDRLLAAFRDARGLVRHKASGYGPGAAAAVVEELDGRYRGYDGRRLLPHYDRILGLIKQAKAMQGNTMWCYKSSLYGHKGYESGLPATLTPTTSIQNTTFYRFHGPCAKNDGGRGCMALINQHSWMFLSSYRRFRKIS